jgi:hypothetical protein
MRRKILMGVFAFALPIGMIAAFGTAASAKTKPAPDPARSCTAHGTVHFQSPGLSADGSVSSTLKVSDTTTSGVGFGGCTGSVPNLVIASKNTKCKGTTAGTKCPAKVKGTKYVWYTYDGESTFASGSTITSLEKSLKKLDFTIDGVTYATKTTGASAAGTCVDAGLGGTEAGFIINGTVKSPKQDKGETTTLKACLGSDTGPGTSGFFFADLGSGTGTIVTASIDPVSSTVNVS